MDYPRVKDRTTKQQQAGGGRDNGIRTHVNRASAFFPRPRCAKNCERVRRHPGAQATPRRRIPGAPKEKGASSFRVRSTLPLGGGMARCQSPYRPSWWVGGGAAPLVGATPLVDPLCRAGGWPPWWVGPSNLIGRGGIASKLASKKFTNKKLHVLEANKNQ